LSATRLYRGINRDGKNVSVIAGDVDAVVIDAVEKFTGDPIGQPATGTAVTPIGDISGLVISPPKDEDRVLKYEESVVLNKEAELINDLISQNGLKVIPESAEEHILKAETDDEEDEEERTVFSVALEPNDGENGAPLDPDKQDEIYSADAIRKTAHRWLENGGVVGLMHRIDVSPHVAVLESYLAPVDFVFKNGKKSHKIRKGTWLVRLRIYNDELWEAIKKGDFGAFSVGGTAIKRTEEVPVNG